MPSKKPVELYGGGLQAPDGPHMVLVDAETMSGTGIPVGSLLAVVLDAKDRNKVFPMVLTRISSKLVLEFRCACGIDGCTLTYQFKPAMKGSHPHLWK